MLNMMAVRLAVWLLGAALVVATTETVTITSTTTETKCAASCYSTIDICTHPNTDIPTYSVPSPASTESAPPATETYPDIPSSPPSYPPPCTDPLTCFATPSLPVYTTPEAESSELPVTTGYAPSSQDSDTWSTRDSCWSSEHTSSEYATTPEYTETGSSTSPAQTSVYSHPSDITYSTETGTTTVIDATPLPSVSLSTNSPDYGYPPPSYESRVDATETSWRTTAPTTFVTNTRDYSSESSSSTENSPPAYGTATEEPASYDDPPAYTEPPSYGGAKLRAV